MPISDSYVARDILYALFAIFGGPLVSAAVAVVVTVVPRAGR